ncbi:hypothetical protein L1F30_16045 [Simiduia sp. 21SJ11W-1]|uniref:hypothetical protein n=1 Tax=Simiduia sp. 21SJ11W-1 TaxID=2909669 RepID=UPI0020A050B1|nr:hypothetical protein [Simiduia sp. 21SJ11W-1]UTA47653.1 hypothetical protein L1F30_16045 [Simiduia sp. 21SJ11W-1]
MIKNIIIFVLFSVLSAGGYFVNKTIDGLKAAIVTMQLKHRKDIVKVKLKERAKRLVTIAPFVGAVAAGWFEKREYEEWKQENPEGTIDDYLAELQEAASELMGSYCADYEDGCSTLGEAASGQ